MSRPTLQLSIERGFRLAALRRDAAPSRLRLVLVRVRPRRPQVVTRTASTTIRQQIRLVLAPRYELTRHRHDASLAPPEVREAAAARHEVERLVERIVTRSTRVEARARPAAARETARRELWPAPTASPSRAFPARVPEPEARSLAPAFPRLVPPRLATAAVPRPEAPPAPPAQSLLAGPQAHVLRPEASPDLARIADRVLETLDRRLIAERERRGRI